MNNADKTDSHRELIFPVEWEYRIIIEADRFDAACTAVRKCLSEHGVPSPLHEGRHSKAGRYRTLRVPVVLTGREMMNALSAALAAADGVKFLL